MRRPLTVVVAIATAGLLALACGGPSAQAKECTGGGSADEATFGQSFTEMGFGSGAPSTGEGGQRFGPSDPVIVKVVAKAATPVRFCAQERGRVSTVVYDQTQTVPAGESAVSLGPFSKRGNYVVRIAVNGVLVKNLPFVVE